MSMIPLDLSLPTQDAFYKALSAANAKGLTLTPADIRASVPVADDSHADANTRITLTPVPGSTKVYGPAEDFWYHRRSLTELLVDLEFGETLPHSDVAAQWPEGNIDNVTLATLNYKFESKFTADELIITELVRDADHVEIEVAMRDGNLALYGALTLIVTFLK